MNKKRKINLNGVADINVLSKNGDIDYFDEFIKENGVASIDTIDNKLSPKVEKLPIKKIINLLKKFTLSDKQIVGMDIIDSNQITFVHGPPGTSKTFLSLYYAAQELAYHNYDKIILTKPIKEAGENLGFLPGSVDDKIGPHYESFEILLKQFVDKKTLETMTKNERIVYKPMTYMRGATYNSSIIIVDEAQNLDAKSLYLLITRLGHDSKIIIAGDTYQSDIKESYVALNWMIDMLSDLDEIGSFEFGHEDVRRSKLLIEVTRRYEAAVKNRNTPKNIY